jgi:hypothetical protein
MVDLARCSDLIIQTKVGLKYRSWASVEVKKVVQYRIYVGHLRQLLGRYGTGTPTGPDLTLYLDPVQTGSGSYPMRPS